MNAVNSKNIGEMQTRDFHTEISWRLFIKIVSGVGASWLELLGCYVYLPKINLSNANWPNVVLACLQRKNFDWPTGSS